MPMTISQSPVSPRISFFGSTAAFMFVFPGCWARFPQ
jgi:hypothetical protein